MQFVRHTAYVQHYQQNYITMAFQSPSTTNISLTPISVAPLAHNNNPLILISCQFSFFRNQIHRHHFGTKTLIKAATNDDDIQTPLERTKEGLKYTPLDRRNMLIGLGGLYGASTTLGGLPKTALAIPAIPDVSKCYLTDDEQKGLNCCPPIPFPHDINQIPAFNPKNYPSPVTRVRPPAHKVATNKEYLDMFAEGIRRMKCLPKSDPRSFIQQANVHCAYCDGGYHLLENPNADFLVHGSWLFLPFHRGYLYFFERILNKLLEDDQYSFAMPFWNWDHPDGMKMPIIYTDPNSPLYDPLRNSKHQPPTEIDLNYHLPGEEVSNEDQIHRNLCYMYKQVVEAVPAACFMGRHNIVGDRTEHHAGSLELCPHDNVHNWTGDPNQPYVQDMGAFFSAGRDPIFYAHHANVDRIWSIWNNKLGPKRHNCSETDFKDACFVFYDENANPVKIYVRDCFDTLKLGYDYEEVGIPWKNPPLASAAMQKKELERRKRSPSSSPNIIDEVKDHPLESVIRTRVKRSSVKPRKKDATHKEEVLAVRVELKQHDIFAKFDVYINDQYEHEPSESTKCTKEFAGSFSSLPHRPKKSGKKQGHDGYNMVHNLKLPLTKLIEDIGAKGDDHLEVVLVPRAGKEAIIIKTVEIELLSCDSCM